MDYASFFTDDGYNDVQDVKSFIKKFSDHSPEGLTEIITKYINYDSAAVSAALFLSVEKGLISFDLKELLWKQIVANFSAFSRSSKNFGWERKNVFIEYFTTYSDDELYNISDNPNGLVTDVYHAVLSVAWDRELISEADFKSYYEDAKSEEGFRVEKGTGVFENLLKIDEPDTDFLSDAEIATEQEKLWKCPECNQLVDMELAVCWSCQAPMPEVPEHPAREAVMKEHKEFKNWSFVRSGFYLIATGILVALLNYIRHYIGFLHRHTHKVEIVFGGFFVLIGVVFVIYGLFFQSEPDSFMNRRKRF